MLCDRIAAPQTHLLVSISPASTPLHYQLDVQVLQPTTNHPAAPHAPGRPPASAPAAAPAPPSTSAVALQFTAALRCAAPPPFALSLQIVCVASQKTVSVSLSRALCPRRRKLRMSGLRAQLLITPNEPLPPSATAKRPGHRARAPSTAAAPLGTSSRGAASIAAQPRAPPAPRRPPSAHLPAAQAHADAPGGLPAAAAPSGAFSVHVTPLRCSRALALRHLAMRFHKPLPACWTLVTCPAAPAAPASGAPPAAQQWTLSGQAVGVGGGGGKAQAPAAAALMCASDGDDLVGGAQPVVVLPPNKQVACGVEGAGQQGGPRCSVAFPVDLQPYGPVVAAAAPGGAQARAGRVTVVVAGEGRR